MGAAEGPGGSLTTPANVLNRTMDCLFSGGRARPKLLIKINSAAAFCWYKACGCQRLI
jgi:hypothetical protein